MIECVPALTEVVQDGSSSGSDAESGEDADTLDGNNAGKKSISPGHARDVDAAGKVLVQSIMGDANGEILTAAEYEYSDDEDDTAVGNMVKLIEEEFPFNTGCFSGGVSRQDVSRMREETKADLVNRKSVKTKTAPSPQVEDGVDADWLASIVRDKAKEDFLLVVGEISALKESFNSFKSSVLTDMGDIYGQLQANVLKIAALSSDIRDLVCTAPPPPPETSNRQRTVVDSTTQTNGRTSNIINEAIQFANRATAGASQGDPNVVSTTTEVSGVSERHQSLGSVEVDNNGHADCEAGQSSPPAPEVHQPEAVEVELNMESKFDPALLFPNPTFSLNLSQEPTGEGPKDANKVPTKSLLGEYECGRGFLKRARKAVSDAIYKGKNVDYSAKFAVLREMMKSTFCLAHQKGEIHGEELIEVVERSGHLSTKVVDVLMFHVSSLFVSRAAPDQLSSCVILDTQFVSQFTKLYTKFSKCSKKDSYKFPANLGQMIQARPSSADAERFYFPFNLDKQYWVGICVDCSSWTVTILDCNVSLRTDPMMNKEVKPIAVMFPYLLKQMGRKFGSREGKAMSIERPRSIPQQNVPTDSGISSVIFIQSHAVGGVDVCKCITPDVLASEVERLLFCVVAMDIGPGIPRRCLCGALTVLLTSKTKENPGRRFYRCGVVFGDNHVFKWADDAYLEELELIAEKQSSMGKSGVVVSNALAPAARDPSTNTFHLQPEETLTRVSPLEKYLNFLGLPGGRRVAGGANWRSVILDAISNSPFEDVSGSMVPLEAILYGSMTRT
ncbi:hypothetical protein Bca101_019864 [Brassica carinata]